MKKTPISVTDAARNFADCVNRVHYQNVTFVLLKNGSPVAQLTPSVEKSFLAGDLAKSLGRVRLTAEEARTWRHDLHKARKALKPPVDKWQ